MSARKFKSTLGLLIALSVGSVSALVGVTPAAATSAPDPAPSPAVVQAPVALTTAGPATDSSTLAAATDAAASTEAKASKKMVNVTSDTTENSITWANPDGSFTLNETGSPVRVADTSSTSGWRDIDDTLVENEDGTVSPKSAYLPLTLSGAATASKVTQSGVVAVADGEGPSVKFGWNGALPQPTLDGDTATYTNVEPNLNIVVTMTATGFEQFFELTAPPTASELNLALPMTAPGLSSKLRTDGGIDFSNSTKNVIGSIAPAFMWDARTDPVSGLPSHQAPLSLSATSKTLDVTSPTSYFADPAIQYPVTIDPTWSSIPSADTFVRKDFPTTNYQSYTPLELQVGTYNSGTSVSRSFLNFSTSGWLGSTVTGATLSLYEFHSYNCVASTMYVRYANLETPTTTWNTQPGTSTSYQSASSFSKGYSSACPATYVGIDVGSLISYDASTAGSTIGIGLIAASETADSSWKRFNSEDAASGKPSLTVYYFHTPSVPAAAIFSSPLRSCGTSTSPAMVNGTQALSLTSTVADADSGATMTDTAEVDVATLSGTTLTATGTVATTATSATATSGSVTMPIVAGALSPGYYAVRTRTLATAYAGYTAANSAWSSYCYFVVKNSAPALPTVNLYGAAATTVGGSMQVTFSSPVTDGPAVFAYWWVPDNSSTSPTVPVTGTPADVTTGSSLPTDGSGDGQVRYAVVPVTVGLSGTVTSAPVTVAPTNRSATLWVAVFDGAGNVSSNGGSPAGNATGYTLTGLAADPGVSDSLGHNWSLDSLTAPLGTSVQDTNTNSGSSITSESDLSLGSTQAGDATDLGTGGPSFAFSGAASDTVTSAHQVVDTTHPFTVSAWVQASTVTSGAPLIAVSQAAAGSGTAAFKLGMSGDAVGRYEFCVRPQAVAGAQVCAYGPAAVANTPEFISGIWDPANHQIRLLVGNQLAAVGWAPYALPPGETSSTGPLLVGADWATGALASEWKGYVTDPSIFPGILDDTQLLNLAYPHDVNF